MRLRDLIKVARLYTKEEPMSYPIFIAPLPRHFTSAELAALFRPFGRVVLAKVIYDSVGQSLQYGRVQMETDEGADNACRHLDRTIFQKATLAVMRAPEFERVHAQRSARDRSRDIMRKQDS